MSKIGLLAKPIISFLNQIKQIEHKTTICAVRISADQCGSTAEQQK